jgi:hypothetical protein
MRTVRTHCHARRKISLYGVTVRVKGEFFEGFSWGG